MKFKTLLTLFALIVLSSCQEVINMGELAKKENEAREQQELKERKEKRKKAEVPKDGIITKKNKRSNTTVEIEYKNGKKNGTSREYYADGTLWKESDYQDNLLHGVAKVYSREGKLEREVHYVEGKKDGAFIRYFKSGNPKLKITFDQNLPMPGGIQKNYKGEDIPAPRINIQHIDQLKQNGTYTLKFSLDPPAKGVTFYAFDKDNLWKPETRRDLYSLPPDGKLTFELAPGYFIARELFIYATYKSKWGDEMVTQTRMNLAVENS
ncbi:MAG: toxin-antitoxin system YwqK family antitoxin [Owenweeksia sp.]